MTRWLLRSVPDGELAVISIVRTPIDRRSRANVWRSGISAAAAALLQARLCFHGLQACRYMLASHAGRSFPAVASFSQAADGMEASDLASSTKMKSQCRVAGSNCSVLSCVTGSCIGSRSLQSAVPVIRTACSHAQLAVTSQHVTMHGRFSKALHRVVIPSAQAIECSCRRQEHASLQTVITCLVDCRQCMSNIPCRADKPVIMRTLKHASIGIIVEGIAGIYDGATIDQERVFLLQRKGFIKCAIQAGVGAFEPAITWRLGDPSDILLSCQGW